MEGVSHTVGRPLKPEPPQYAVLDLGIAPYEPVQTLQKRLRAAVADGRLPGVLMLLEHEPVVTLGSRAGSQDLRPAETARPELAECGLPRAEDVEIVRSERGGQATVHAPGQLVSYPIVPIPGHDLSGYVRDLEQTIILLLAGLGIQGERRYGRPGVYVAGAKISSVGLRCQRWVSSHGTSLNVSVDLGLFDRIVSCGEPGLRQTSIARILGGSFDMNTAKQLYIQAVTQIFEWNLAPLTRTSFDRVEDYLGLSV